VAAGSDAAGDVIATRRAFAMIVKVGFTAPIEDMKLLSAT
jgi:hypothetical protein